MKAEALLREGKLDEAVEVLNSWLRENPDDTPNRTFLFELLCFQGAYDRARKHLALLSEGGKEAALGALLLEGAIHAESLRLEMFENDNYPASLPAESSQVSGVLNGTPFSSITDADPRIGPRLELFAAGNYMWVPFHQIASLTVPAPVRLRDLLWTPARVAMQSGFEQKELGELLIPALTPMTFRHPDPLVRLGRVSEWCSDEQDKERPYGQKMLLVDGEEFPLLEIRKLEVNRTVAASS
jgi:type VI secretion system protein ImpE